MFTIDASIKDFSGLTQNLYRVLFSMNNHMVATPELSPEEARSYVLFLREGKQRYSVYVGLYFLHTDRRMFYAHSSNPFLEEDLQEVEEDARIFAEDLGAMLDEINFEKMSDLDRERWIEEQSIFGPKKDTTAAPAVPVSPAPAAVREEPVPSAPPVEQQPSPVVQEQPQSPPAPSLQPAAPQAPVSQPAAPNVPAVSPTPTPEPQATVVVSQYVQPEFVPAAAPPVAPEQPQETAPKAVRPSAARPQRKQQKQNPLSPTSVVTRDREALARLFTSF
jgi:hypothetical protein